MENKSTGQEQQTWYNFNNQYKGLEVADSVRTLQIISVPPIWKPVTWAEKMFEKLIAQAIRKQTLRNKWILYPLTILFTLLGMSVVIFLAFLCYSYAHASSPFFGIIAVDVGIVCWMISKDHLEKVFPIGDWETMRFKRKRHGHTKTYY